MATKAVVNNATLDAIATAINTKAGTTGTMKPSEMAAKIAAIQIGRWMPPTGWPDLWKIDKHGYDYMVAYLFKADDEYPTFEMSGGLKYVTSDGYYGDGGTHTWDETKDIVVGNERYRWAAILTNSDTVNLSSTQVSYNNTLWLSAVGVNIRSIARSGIGIFYGARILRCIEAKGIYNIGNNSYGDFRDTNSLERADISLYSTCVGNSYAQWINTGINRADFTIMWRGDKTGSGLLGGLNNSIRIKRVEIVGPSNNFDKWYNATGLKFMPEEYICMNQINGGNVDYRLNPYATPRVFNTNVSFMFGATSYLAEFKYLFARFIDGNLVDGLAFNMNEVDSSLGLTATISAKIKGFFTAPNDPADGTSEQEKIEAAFNAKGWTLAW